MVIFHCYVNVYQRVSRFNFDALNMLTWSIPQSSLQHRGAFPRWEFLLVYIQKFDGKLIFPWVVSLHPDIFMVRYAHGWLVMIGLLFLLACWVRSILTSFPFDHTPEDHICSTTSRWSEWSLWFLHLSISNDNVHDRPWSSMHSLCRSLRVVWLPFCTWCWALDMFNTDQPAMTWFGGFPNPVHAPVSMLSHGQP